MAERWREGVTSDDGAWRLQLGPIALQCPLRITAGEPARCRVAWLADEGVLLRVEAPVATLENMAEGVGGVRLISARVFSTNAPAVQPAEA